MRKRYFVLNLNHCKRSNRSRHSKQEMRKQCCVKELLMKSSKGEIKLTKNFWNREWVTFDNNLHWLNKM
eukprot:1326742-Prorocentrum_lima.AAC.1